MSFPRSTNYGNIARSSGQTAAQLTANRQRIWTESKRTLDAATAEKRELTGTEQRAFDQANTEMDALATQIRDAEAQERSNLEVERNLTRTLGAGNTGGYGFNANGTPTNPGGNTGARWGTHENGQWGKRSGLATFLVEQRALGYSNASAVLPTVYYGQWFDRLRAASVVLSAGPQLIPVEAHNVILPALTASTTIAAVAEGVALNISDPSVAPITLTPRKYGALVQASNESLRDSSGVLADLIVNDLIRSTASQLDIDFLVGPGTGTTIKGLKNQTGVTAASFPGGNGAVPALDDILTQIVFLQGLGSKLEDLAIFLNPGVFGVLQKAKASTAGTYLFGDPTAAPTHTLFGVRVFPTGNLGQGETVGTSSGVCSTIIVADMSRVAIGVGQEVTVATSEDFYFGSDSTAVKVTARFDLGLIQPAGVVVLPGAKIS